MTAAVHREDGTEMTYVVTEARIKCKYTDCTEEEVPEDQFDFIRINAEAAKVWPPITQRKPAPEDAGEWAKVKDKRALLEFA